MKKITLFINSLTSGGAERVLSVIATELVAQNYQVELLCLEKDNAYALPKEVNIVYLSNLNKHDSSIKKFLFLPYLALKLKAHVKAHNISLIQSHIYRANFTNILAKLFGAKHQVQVVEVTSINNLKVGGLSKKINFLLVKFFYKHADLIVFKAQKMREEFLNNFPKSSNNIVINNPYNIEQIENLAKEPVTDFEFKKEKKYIVTVGRLSSEKRLLKLIESIEKLEEHIELLIIGEGTQKEELLAFVEEKKLEKRVHLLGKKENPFNYINHSDIFVLASEGEGFPNVLVEAMICNTAVVSTDCISGPREILAPKSDISFQLKENIELAQNGILYPVDDMEALQKAIMLLLENAELKKKYEKKAKEQTKAYALDKIIAKYKGALCVE